MHRTTMLLGSFAILFGAAGTLAQEPPSEAKAPMATAWRDAQRLADCMQASDADCVVSLSDAKSYSLLNTANWNFRESQARWFDGLRHAGWKYTGWVTSSPHELFIDSGRFYTFVPYVQTIAREDQQSTILSYFIAFSADRGETWTFVDGGPTPDKIRLIIPSYAGQPLPPVRHLN